MYRSIIFCSLAVFILAVAMPGQAHADLMQDAVMDYQFQDFKEAEKKFRKVLEQHPDDISAHYYMGLVLQQNGKLKEAIEHLELVKFKSKDTPVEGIDDALASAYSAAEMPEKALPIYKKKYAADKKDDANALAYAKALQSSGDIPAARVIYRTLIEKNSPQKDAARFQMAQSFVASKAYATAMGELKEIDAKSPYGPAAKSYMDALAPAVKPISLYLSSEWYFHDNPGSASSSRLPGTTTAVTPGSQGLTQIAALNTRAFEWTEKLKVKIAYLYYAMLHRTKKAKTNDFVGHFINPEITYQATKSINIALKGDIQFFYFAHQKLSFNSGGKLTTTWTDDRGDNIALQGNFIAKNYTNHFFSAGASTAVLSTSTSLAYLDAKKIGIGISTSLVGPDEKGSLSIEYAFNMERPTHTNSADANLAAKSSDSKFNEHAVRIDGSIPFPGKYSQFSLLGNYSYSYRDYRNKQDAGGLLYPEIPGQFITAVSSTYGAQIQINDFVKIRGHGISASFGYEHNKAHATAPSLSYKSNKYMGSFSGVL
ncbi:MAG: tetratricopeptide repeat protein [Mariprofundaceae bacterium]|nr:tetratricopeptide repeat protein [Mariprofundaceae bacterium]